MAIQLQNRRGTASQWTSSNPTLANGEIGFESDTGKFKIGTGSSTWSALSYAGGIDSLSRSGGVTTVSESLTVSGSLTVLGTTTTINSTTLAVTDKNVEIANVGSPTNTTADGAGITVKGATDKTFNWINSTGAWTSSEDLNLASGKVYKINGTNINAVSETLTNKTVSGGTLSGATIVSPTFSGGATIPSLTLSGSVGGSANGNTLTIDYPTFTTPTLSGAYATGTFNFTNATLSGGTIVGSTISGTLASSNATFTTPTLSGGTIKGVTLSGTITYATGISLVGLPDEFMLLMGAYI